MTPRSPRGSKGLVRGPSVAVLANNSMDKWTETMKEEETGEAFVLCASCSDDKHAPESVLSGRGKAFWSTTGMYPQEIVVALKEEMRVAEIKTVTAGVKKMSIERVIPKKTVAANATSGIQWTRIDTIDVPLNGGQLQVESQKCNVSAKYLKFIIHSGWDDFAAIMEIKVNANGKWIC